MEIHPGSSAALALRLSPEGTAGPERAAVATCRAITRPSDAEGALRGGPHPGTWHDYCGFCAVARPRVCRSDSGIGSLGSPVACESLRLLPPRPRRRATRAPLRAPSLPVTTSRVRRVSAARPRDRPTTATLHELKLPLSGRRMRGRLRRGHPRDGPTPRDRLHPRESTRPTMRPGERIWSPAPLQTHHPAARQAWATGPRARRGRSPG